MHSNYAIGNKGAVSEWFLNKYCQTFDEASTFIQKLHYRRNKFPEYLCVMREMQGVCSTKHALLKRLCEEHEQQDYKLIVGIYKMNDYNTNGVGKVLEKYNLPNIPEAHTYLKNGTEILDFTKVNNDLRFLESLIDEVEIEAHQIGEYKIEIHKKYIHDWLLKSGYINQYNIETAWKIREECIISLFQ